jgi:hypothetical protein
VDHGLIAKVQGELVRLQTEKAHSELIAHRTFIIQLAKEFRREESVSRRRSMREFEKQYHLAARKVLYEIAEAERAQSRSTRNA